MTEPYRALVELAERERELIAADRLEELAELVARRDAIVAALPSTPPATARPLLERAAELQSENTRALAAAVRAARDDLGRLKGGRAAVRVYSPAGAGPTRLVDRAG